MPALKVLPAPLVAVPLGGAAALLVVAHACVAEPHQLFLAVLHSLDDKLLSTLHVFDGAVCLEVAYLVAGFIVHRVPRTQ